MPDEVSNDIDLRPRSIGELELAGGRVALGPLRPELFPLHHTWVNDPEVGWNVFGVPRSRSFEEERDWLVRESADPANRFWLVYRTDEHRPIGVTSLTEIDEVPGSAMFRILIGAERDRGHGFGTEAGKLVLGHGFGDLGLREIRLVVYSFNLVGIRMYQRLGFNEVSRQPMTTLRDGVRWEAIQMARSKP